MGLSPFSCTQQSPGARFSPYVHHVRYSPKRASGFTWLTSVDGLEAANRLAPLTSISIGNRDDLRRSEHPLAMPITMPDDRDNLTLIPSLNRLSLHHFAQADDGFTIGKRDLLNTALFQNTYDLILNTREA